MRYLSIIALLCVMGCQSPSDKNENLQSWSFRQLDGTLYEGRELANHSATVFVFLAPLCPLSENYCLQANEFAKQFAGSIDFRAVVTGAFYSKKEIEDFTRQFGLNIPIILDPEKELAELWQATVTPEVFVVDPSGNLQYSGAIDNWFVDLGQQREVVTEFYLRDVLQAIVDGTEIPYRKTAAVGCFIE